MKKAFALLLAFSLIFTFAACGGEKKPSTDNSQSDTVEVEFKAPENYATVLLVTINPEFRLYLDAQGSVLAVEPVNDDAKSIAEDIQNAKGDLDTVIQDIVAASDKGGFVKENATVDLTIVSVKADIVNPDDILNTAKEATNKVFEGSEKTVVVNISVAENALTQTDASKEEATSSSEPASTENTTVKTKTGIWKLQLLSSQTLYNISLSLCGPEGKLSAQYGIGDPLESLPEEMQKDLITNYPESCASFNGKQYYVGRGGGNDIKSVVEDETTVTVTDTDGYKLVLTRTAENSLTVKSADSSFASLTEATIPVGSVFTFKAE